MMSPLQHRDAAERLIAEGEAVVAKIAAAKEQRSGADALDQKKATGIWAQAQVHATLALATGSQVYVLGDRA